MAGDLRNDASRHPWLYWLRSATALDAFDPTTGGWIPLASPALSPAAAAGACMVFHPSAGPRGTLAAGSTSSAINITTALPAAVGINQLANRGDGLGFKIRIIGNGTSSSGLIEERTIIANTGGTTPVITLDSPLSFVPASSDAYEIISGKLYLMGSGALASGTFRSYDVATNFYTTLSQTNLPATVATDGIMVSLSELHVSNDRVPGSGLVAGTASYNAASPINCIQATSVTNTTNAVVTGSAMPALFSNEYTNFQLRIVEDTTNKTAVGQRKRITSHTSGVTGAFTLSGVFAVAPSNNAKFVIECDDDKIICRSSAATSLYNYNITANTWDTSTWAAPVANGAGSCAAHAFGITRDATGNSRQSMIYFVRGGGNSAIDVLDIAAASTGSWSNAIVYQGLSQTFNTGTNGTYDPATFGGRFLHLCVNGTQYFARFDVRNRVMDIGTYIRYPQGTALAGNKMASCLFVDGNTKLTFVYCVLNTLASMFSCAIQR